jgi:hypothetical protein
MQWLSMWKLIDLTNLYIFHFCEVITFVAVAASSDPSGRWNLSAVNGIAVVKSIAHCEVTVRGEDHSSDRRAFEEYASPAYLQRLWNLSPVKCID